MLYKGHTVLTATKHDVDFFKKVCGHFPGKEEYSDSCGEMTPHFVKQFDVF